jgi:hypothetical protein
VAPTFDLEARDRMMQRAGYQAERAERAGRKVSE